MRATRRPSTLPYRNFWRRQASRLYFQDGIWDSVASIRARGSLGGSPGGAAELDRLPLPRARVRCFTLHVIAEQSASKISRKPRTLTECNCSICGRLAARWAYYSARSVRVLCNPGALQAYVYKSGTFEYKHCKICGCVTHYRRINTDNNERIAVNSRMMVPEDVTSIKVVRLDVRKASNRPS